MAWVPHSRRSDDSGTWPPGNVRDYLYNNGAECTLHITPRSSRDEFDLLVLTVSVGFNLIGTGDRVRHRDLRRDGAAAAPLGGNAADACVAAMLM